MTHDPRDAAFGATARAAFEAQVRGTDGATATALRARRHAALQRLRPATGPHWLPWGAAVAAVLTLAVWLPEDPPDAPSAPATPIEAAAVAGSETDLAAWADDDATAELDDDPEFYRWLAEAPIAPDPTDSLGELL